MPLIDWLPNETPFTVPNSNSWNEVSLPSAAIGAQGVVIRARNTIPGSLTIGVRATGASDSTWGALGPTSQAEYFVFTDGADTAEFYAGVFPESIEWAVIGVIPTGSHMTLLESPVGIGTANDEGSWTEIDASSAVPAGASAVIARIVSTEAKNLRLRLDATWDALTESIQLGFQGPMGMIFPLTGGGTFQAMASNLEFSAIGYVSGGLVIDERPVNDTPNVTGAWRRLNETLYGGLYVFGNLVGEEPPADFFFGIRAVGAAGSPSDWVTRGQGGLSGMFALVGERAEAQVSQNSTGRLWRLARIAAPAARIRSHISEDVGSLFQATQATAVETAVSEAFPYASEISAGTLRPFAEALTPESAAIQYYPIPTRNQEMLVTVEGETNLGRLARVYPGRIMERIEDIASFSGATSATAQEAIEYIFSQWASAFSWFTFEDVPDLRLLEAEAVGNERQHYIDNATAGLLTIEAIAIPQDGDNRKSMREIVDEWLAIFPGTIIRQNSNGNIELVARVGPDAPVAAAVDVAWRDIISISDGEDDPRGVINRARCESQGFEWQDEQVVAAPAYYITGGLDEVVLTAEGVHPEDDPREKIVLWQQLNFAESVIVQETAVDVTVAITVYGNGDDDVSQGFYTEATHSEVISLLPGETKTVEVSYNVQLQDTTLRAYVQRLDAGVMITAVTGGFAQASAGFTTTYLSNVIRIDASGTSWARSVSAITGEFGYASGDSLPSVGGGDVLTDSVALYGEREATIRSSVFQLTAEQAQQVARSYVLANINPRTIRDVQQSEWGKYPIKFDHIGRLVDLPNGETAVVENRSYTDSFAADGGMMQSTFTATVTDIVIDTETAYLYMDDGSYMQLDDGSIAEEQ